MQNSWPAIPNTNDPRLVGRRYYLDRSLGEGGFAEVFYAYDIRFQPHRPVALKLLYPQLLTDPQVCRDLQNEASALAAFNHPNILKVLDFEFSPVQAYLVTELAEGGSLDNVLRPAGQPTTRIPLRQALIYLEQLAAALDEAHRAGVIHRDIKPKNILLDRQGKILLADFGLAMTINNSVALKTMQSVFGTPEYTAPEVWEDKVGKASDIYALGAVLFEMLAGQAPFQGSLPALLKQHLHDPVPRLADRQPDLAYPVAMDNLLAQAMAKDPAQRPRSATELYRLAREVYKNSLVSRANGYATTVPMPGPVNVPPPPAPHFDPAPPPGPAQAQPQPKINPAVSLNQLPVGELFSDLTAQWKAPHTGGKLKKAGRMGGTFLEHTYKHKETYIKAFHEFKGVIYPAGNVQPEELLKRGIKLVSKQQYKKALTDLTEGLRFDSPAKAELYYWRGVARRALKDKRAAREDFKQAARLGNIPAQEALKNMPTSFFDMLLDIWKLFFGGRHSGHTGQP